MLADAQEKVSPGVWSAVSSRLDKAAAAPVKAVSPAWKWAGAAFAVAAGLAALLLIPGGNTVSTVPSVTEPVARTLVEAPVPDIIMPEFKAPVALSQLLPRPVGDAVAHMASEQPSETGSFETESYEAAPSEVRIPEDRTPEEKIEVIETPDNTANLLARLEYEDSHKKSSSLSDLTLGGTLAGNTATRLTVSSMSGGTGSVPTEDVMNERSVSSFGIPFTVGLGIRWQLVPRFYIGTGLDYSLLTRTFAGSYTAAGTLDSIQGDVRNTMHYLGIPLNLFYDIVQTPIIHFYVYGGGEIEYCVSNKFVLRPAAGTPVTMSKAAQSPQFSTKFGVGVQFRLADHVGLYLDPGVSYYFYSGQPKSIRTEQPFMFNFNAGLRFDF